MPDLDHAGTTPTAGTADPEAPLAAGGRLAVWPGCATWR